ncbi:hypothetical protein ACLOJK_006710 [Asimina triloba]
MKKSSREKGKKATLDACRDEVFRTPYGGGGDDDDDDDDDNEDDIDIVRRESLRTAAEDEHRRQIINLEEEKTQFTVPQTMIGDEQLFRRSGAKQKKLKQLWNKNIVDNLGKAAAKLFLHNSIPPHVADSPYFQVFVDAAAEASSGVKAPSSYEIDGKYAEEVYNEIWEYYPIARCPKEIWHDWEGKEENEEWSLSNEDRLPLEGRLDPEPDQTRPFS